MLRFFGGPKRNGNWVLEDPRPVTDYGNDTNSGDAAKDGYCVLSRADPNYPGMRPPVAGTLRPAHNGPDDSFEQ